MAFIFFLYVPGDIPFNFWNERWKVEIELNPLSVAMRSMV